MKKAINYFINMINPTFNLLQYSQAKKAAVTVLTTSLLIVNQAHAASLSNSVVELSDETLSDMRGKFISSGEMRYFGVEMVTHWQTSTGELVIATANLGVDFTGSEPQIGFVPTITVQQNEGATATPSSTQNDSVATGGAGLDNVTGVVQNIQVAGVSNGVTNTIGLTVESSSTPTANNLPPVSGSQSLSETTPNGTIASVGLSNNQIGVAVIVPDQGHAAQQIRSTATGGQVQQSVQIGGNLNQIGNRINLNVQMKSLPSNVSSGIVNSVFSSMRLLPPTGSF